MDTSLLRAIHHTPAGQRDLPSGNLEIPDEQTREASQSRLGIALDPRDHSRSRFEPAPQEHTQHFQHREKNEGVLFQFLKQIKSALPRRKADFCTSFKKGPTKAKCLYFRIFLLHSSRKEFILLPASLLNLLDKVLLL